ncbi:hypothetical protein MA16_Dca025411 [Dendrobium catenatum]|uniref:Uncharacterized protein n=1 Tax=Dendrobium catenatum TaxID=906689 RepID=A0A2I0WIW9_9ASPA|nr:hypothetical protein MA16_Dca025411 [Dendrobium catenatum]
MDHTSVVQQKEMVVDAYIPELFESAVSQNSSLIKLKLAKEVSFSNWSRFSAYFMRKKNELRFSACFKRKQKESRFSACFRRKQKELVLNLLQEDEKGVGFSSCFRRKQKEMGSLPRLGLRKGVL